MAAPIPKNSVWSAMSYQPPRGKCNYKTSLMSPTCPCLRFMLHPVKAATSFECDGCNHHASYHSLENPTEDAVLKKWAEQETEARESEGTRAGSSKKRKLLTQSANVADEVVFGAQITEVIEEVTSSSSRAKARSRKPKKGGATIDMTGD